ncbi:MAG: anthranilate synthase component 2 [Roseivirga sp.]|jgi:anthranilate synthase component 2
MSTLVLDNYDSFTFNLVHILRQLKVPHEVHRNDKISVDEAGRFDRILFSPGPGIPAEAGNMPAIIAKHISHIPMLGICLGHQAIAEHLGAQLENMPKVFHGVNTPIVQCSDSLIFKGVPSTFDAGRYHSWKVSLQNLPDTITVTAEDEAGDIMAFDAAGLRAYGIQFHPESVMTPQGNLMIENFSKL